MPKTRLFCSALPVSLAASSSPPDNRRLPQHLHSCCMPTAKIRYCVLNQPSTTFRPNQFEQFEAVYLSAKEQSDAWVALWSDYWSNGIPLTAR
jgi:hypothetical protein